MSRLQTFSRRTPNEREKGLRVGHLFSATALLARFRSTDEVGQNILDVGIAIKMRARPHERAQVSDDARVDLDRREVATAQE